MGARAEGRGSYFGDGRSHIFNFSIESEPKSSPGNEITLDKPTKVRITAKVCARLAPEIIEATEKIRTASRFDRPYWHIERARREGTRKVFVELIVNGEAVQRTEIEGDGIVRPVSFDALIAKSSWVALRILPSSHTNPIFVLIQGAAVRASRKSAEWCRQGVDICWESKSS